ncbi:MAG: hypothetical protein NTW19_21860 [Planctomycetota bacterium]|nr:hypothetical protein [Planctomycetota bacterium]
MAGRDEIVRGVGDALFGLRDRLSRWRERVVGAGGKPGAIAQAASRVASADWGLLVSPGRWVDKLRQTRGARESGGRADNLSFFDAHPVIVTAIALAVLAGSLYSVKTPPPPPMPAMSFAWYYDLQTRRMAVMPDGIAPPAAPLVKIVNPDRDEAPPPSMVRAHLFSCGECDDVNSRFLGYLESTEPDPAAPVAPAAEQQAAEASETPAASEPSETSEAPLVQAAPPPATTAAAAQDAEALPPVAAAIVPSPFGYAIPAGRVRVLAVPADEIEWVPAEQPAAKSVLAAPQNRCKQATATECRPANLQSPALPRSSEEIESNPSSY